MILIFVNNLFITIFLQYYKYKYKVINYGYRSTKLTANQTIIIITNPIDTLKKIIHPCRIATIYFLTIKSKI